MLFHTTQIEVSSPLDLRLNNWVFLPEIKKYKSKGGGGGGGGRSVITEILFLLAGKLAYIYGVPYNQLGGL